MRCPSERELSELSELTESSWGEDDMSPQNRKQAPVHHNTKGAIGWEKRYGL